ncbi:MAG: endonuclease III domain-containing protein [bacterium]
MQFSLRFIQDSRLPEINRRLGLAWSKPEQDKADPLSQLVFLTIAEGGERILVLAAYERVIARYRNWGDLRDAAPETLLPLLRGVNDAAQKATTLPRLLQAIEDSHGVLELDFLAGWSIESARRYLADLPGVNDIIAAAVLNFSSLSKSIMTIDKTVARPLRRLGLASPGAPLSALERELEEKLPDHWQAKDLADLYTGLRKLAETVCHKGRGKCKSCPLNDLCPSAQQPSAHIIRFPTQRVAKTSF